ncbi:MAG: EAL domain-containing protein [Thermodesulfovibrionales bacterium]|nr:EAL domain-containing protein [Thermodesulfovibrionales bacterium]
MSTWTKKDEVVSRLLRRGFYSTMFQPIVDLRDTTPVGFEALLRGPEGTPFESPGPLFNNCGELSEDVLLKLDMACMGSALRTSGPLPPDSRLFINIKGSTLLELSTDLGGLMDLLSELDIPASRVVFELSESMGMESTMEVTRCVQSFRRLGFRFALDDIGVRSPYLYHLLWMEPEYIKLDRTFIKDVDSFERKRDLVEGVVMMASRMGTSLIAEGVESKEEFDTLRYLGVGYVQGFFLGMPARSDQYDGAGTSSISTMLRSVCEG